jgi:membrane-associated phospholipid phosphatase
MRGLAIVALVAITPAYADVVTDWNIAAIDAIRAGNTAPPAASRNLAILHASMYDAVNGIDRTHRPYFVKSAGPAAASSEAAANAAAHRVLVSLFGSRAPIFDDLYARIAGTVRDGPPKTAGTTWGESVGEQYLAWRSDDGIGATIALPATAIDAGRWRRTPPAYASYLLPQWASLRPFIMGNAAEHRPAGPPALRSTRWTADYNEVKAFGVDVGSTRTAEQEQIALFWADGMGTETPPGHWNHIARDVAAARGNTLEENARLFALLNLAMADAAICAWDTKYAYDFWRPVTAIRNGDADGNPDTDPDPEWRPLIVTPPFPEHVSGHSAFSGAAARILALFYGNDRITFTTASDYLPSVYRSYSSFSAAASEAAVSRLYAGIHFRSAIEIGLLAGFGLGDLTFKTTMRPRRRLFRR